MASEICGQELMWYSNISFSCLKDKGHEGPHEWRNEIEYVNDIRVTWQLRDAEVVKETE